MKKYPILFILTAFILGTGSGVWAIDIGGVVKQATGGSSAPDSSSTTTKTENGAVIKNQNPEGVFKKEFKEYLKAQFKYNDFYECFESPYSAILSSAEAKYGSSKRKDAHTAQWLFKTSSRDGRDSCTQVELEDQLGKNMSNAHGVKLNFSSGWCDFLSERNKLPVQ